MKKNPVTSMLATLKDAIPKLDSVRAQARSERDRIVAERETLEARLTQLRNTVLRKDDVLALVEAHVDNVAAGYEARVLRAIGRTFDYSESWTHGDCSVTNTLPTFAQMERGSHGAKFEKFFSLLKPSGGDSEADPVGLACWTNPDGVKAAMRAAFAKAEWNHERHLENARANPPQFDFAYATSHAELRAEYDQVSARLAELDSELQELQDMLAANGVSLD